MPSGYSVSAYPDCKWSFELFYKVFRRQLTQAPEDSDKNNFLYPIRLRPFPANGRPCGSDAYIAI